MPIFAPGHNDMRKQNMIGDISITNPSRNTPTPPSQQSALANATDLLREAGARLGMEVDRAQALADRILGAQDQASCEPATYPVSNRLEAIHAEILGIDRLVSALRLQMDRLDTL